jgi:hypothetical protein
MSIVKTFSSAGKKLPERDRIHSYYPNLAYGNSHPTPFDATPSNEPAAIVAVECKKSAHNNTLSKKMLIFVLSVETDWRHRGELLSFDSSENLENSNEMRLFFLFFVILTLLSCKRECNSVKEKTDNDSIVELENEAKTMHQCQVLRFLGHTLDFNKDISQEFARVCSEDNYLSFDSVTQNVTLYGTTFHLNYVNYHNNRGFILMTSAQPESRQIRIVRDAISKFHGKENFEEDYHYSWLPFTDSTKIGQNYPVIHLRRVRSEEGGTVIIVF